MDERNLNPVHQDPNYEPECNISDNRTFGSILEARLARRGVLKGGLAAAVAGIFGGAALTGCGGSSSSGSTVGAEGGNGGADLIGFRAVPIGEGDSIVVPEGYSTKAIGAWGDPILANNGNFPEFSLNNTGADQAAQIGSHHDGLHYFPIEDSSEDGLLVLNHEYIEPRYMHQAAQGQAFGRGTFPINDDNTRETDQVLREMNAHGVSIYRVRKDAAGEWARIPGDAFNRRITALTPMELSGPVRGSDYVKTKYSPAGTETRGTLNNCAHGVTPWNTYLMSEENWAGYFVNTERTVAQSRYGVRASGTTRYAWEQAESGEEQYTRFNVTPTGTTATDDFRNEPNCFGWMVEVDPYNTSYKPVKRTALGRFAHEGVVFAPAVEGQPVVCYSGDDARFEYIYKFVSAQPYHAATAGGHLLDSGTLYVAQFDEDGSGQWLPLVFGLGALTPANGFTSQADVLVRTRESADAVGATKMDRAEWGAVHPTTREVYFALTNNTRRTEADTANPRVDNRWGHIIRWQEGNESGTATSFSWDIFLLCGPQDDSEFNQAGLDEDQKFVNPDGLWFDADARLWIQTDIGEGSQNQREFAEFGNNQMLAADPANGVLRRFLTGPVGQEITGVITTPDQRTMFMNVQHPGATTTPEAFAAGNFNSSWPFGGNNIPRSATVVITKDDGGKIGS
ncbi:PhoX family phosphatase [Marinobacter sp.]|uniref:PhoX family protein n=1 Tax=Marinobacter sp. TaxID=50741 RepID=UPI0019E92145|nr:PhoX family phosphatase [Marinobacter sp.]MBE0485035.1 PhoX family phosphatase [Marinobacter sp.]